MSNKEQPDFSMIIASAVHDMKNSLSMLLHSVDMLCEELPEQLKDQTQVSTVQYEAERVNNYLIQLLGLYRLQDHRLSVHIDEHYVRDLLDEQVAQYQTMLNGKNIELTIECDEDLTWFFDREIILGVLNNTLNNASRYTKGHIIAMAKVIDNELVIQIHDDGEGYPTAMLEADPGDIMKNINFRTGSTSLGLYFASNVAQLHKQGERKGRITLENGGKLGGGVFSIHLP